ncbi:MAG: hypothetical protein ACR2J9_11680, partial [Gaiellales bacterium]
MTKRALVTTVVAFAISAAFLGGTASAQESDPVVAAPPKAKVLKQVRVWAYVGPRGYLAGAKLTLKDAADRTIATGKTSTRGTYVFNLAATSSLKLPLTVSTSGGKVTATTAKGVVLAKPFQGHLSARIFNATTKNPIVEVSLISTAATQMGSSKQANAKAIAQVRTALGMHKSTPSDVLRLRNSYVGFKQLMVAAHRAGGFDAFISHVADLAAKKQKVAKLRPTSANASGAIPARWIRTGGRPLTRQSSMGASTTICQVGVPTTGSTSDEVITDVAEVGVGTLMKVAGVPTTATNSITGMALGAVGVQGQSSVQSQNAALVSSDLDCLGEQINYLSDQIANLQFTMNVATANNCVTAITDPNAWQGYNFLMSQGGFSKDDPSLVGVYLPKFNNVGNACGGSINNALWGTKGGTNSSWQQLVKNTIGGSKWYIPSQVQQLQTFLSYWGTLVYQQFILTNEYDNYYNYMTAAKQASGATSTGVCNSGSTTATTTFCVWRSNIVQAYPPNMYTDEVGIIGSGLAVNAIPMGVFSPKPLVNLVSGTAAANSKYTVTVKGAQDGYSPTSVNAAWMYNYFLNFTPYSGSGLGNMLYLYHYGQGIHCEVRVQNNCPGPQTDSQSKDFAWDAVGYFNGLGINPKGYGSAVQTFDNPQSTNRTPNDQNGDQFTCSSAADLKTNNNLGTSGATALFNGVNQAPNGGSGPWSDLTSGDVAFFASYWDQYWPARIASSTTGLIGWHGCLGSFNSGGTIYPLSSMPTKPVFASLLTRVW